MHDYDYEKSSLMHILRERFQDLDDEWIEYMVQRLMDSDVSTISTPEDLIVILAEVKDFVDENHSLRKHDYELELLCEELLPWIELIATKEFEIPQEEEGEDLEEGQCELCLRILPLTFHHLIPKSTHRKYLKDYSRTYLNTYGAMVCRHCHSTIHKLAPNNILAEKYNSVEKLLQTDFIKKWIHYATKQKVRIRKDQIMRHGVVYSSKEA